MSGISRSRKNLLKLTVTPTCPYITHKKRMISPTFLFWKSSFFRVYFIFRLVLQNTLTFTFLDAGSASDTFLVIDMRMHVFYRNGLCRAVLCAHSACDTACRTFLHCLRSFGLGRTSYHVRCIVRNQFD